MEVSKVLSLSLTLVTTATFVSTAPITEPANIEAVNVVVKDNFPSALSRLPPLALGTRVSSSSTSPKLPSISWSLLSWVLSSSPSLPLPRPAPAFPLLFSYSSSSSSCEPPITIAFV